jgi:hypothetical protein
MTEAIVEEVEVQTVAWVKDRCYTSIICEKGKVSRHLTHVLTDWGKDTVSCACGKIVRKRTGIKW